MEGADFVAAAQRIHQVIDGEFRASFKGDDRVWIEIRAVDSSAFDVLTEREDIIASVRSRFARVDALPE